MRISIVGPLAPPTGGMAGQTSQLGDLLRREGIAANIVRTNAPYVPHFIGRVRVLRAVFRIVPYITRLWTACGQSDVLHVMANSGLAWHLFAAPAIWIGRLRGVRVIVNYRGGAAEQFLTRSAAIVRRTLGMADVIVVPSEFLRAIFARFGVASMIIPNIVDTERFAPLPDDRKPRKPVDPHVVITRNLEPIYDVGTAIRAFAHLRAHRPGAHLSIAGGGPERARLESLVTELGITEAVTFCGALSRDAIAGLYKRATIMLNSSVVDNAPNALLEAMASGVPIVSTNAGGIPFLVRDRLTAILCPQRDPPALARGMLEILDDPELAARLVENGLRFARSYAWDVVFPQWMQVYRTGAVEGSVTERTEGWRVGP